MKMKFNEKRTHSHGQMTLICDYQRSFTFIYESSRVKKMIKQFSEQIERTKSRQELFIRDETLKIQNLKREKKEKLHKKIIKRANKICPLEDD